MGNFYNFNRLHGAFNGKMPYEGRGLICQTLSKPENPVSSAA
jgi:hypothetical protein